MDKHDGDALMAGGAFAAAVDAAADPGAHAARDAAGRGEPHATTRHANSGAQMTERGPRAIGQQATRTCRLRARNPCYPRPLMLRPEDLRLIPLFRDITPDLLATLTHAMDKKTHPAGHVLFRSGDVPDRFLLLVRGEVTLKEGSDDRFRLRPVSPIGELGSLTGIPRNGEAIAATEVDVWSIATKDLTAFFEKNSEVALRFYRNLLDVVAGKVRRDRARIDDMRGNLIRTQKAMKSVRELVLAEKETPISKPVFEAIDELIEHNRRAHYRVTPMPSLPSSVRLDDGTVATVTELSEGYLKLELPAKEHAKGTELAGVLALPTNEIAVSGRVERAGGDGVVVKLDLLIDAYKAALDDYITRLQMLDYVV